MQGHEVPGVYPRGNKLDEVPTYNKTQLQSHTHTQFKDAIQPTKDII